MLWISQWPNLVSSFIRLFIFAFVSAFALLIRTKLFELATPIRTALLCHFYITRARAHHACVTRHLYEVVGVFCASALSINSFATVGCNRRVIPHKLRGRAHRNRHATWAIMHSIGAAVRCERFKLVWLSCSTGPQFESKRKYEIPVCSLITLEMWLFRFTQLATTTTTTTVTLSQSNDTHFE